MICAWKEYLKLIPSSIRNDVDKHGKNTLLELRLRINESPEMVMPEDSIFLNHIVTADDINFSVNIASQYSPWAAATLSKGYITAPGGHRIGVCGSTVTANGSTSTIRTITSVCIRVSRDFPGCATAALLPDRSILIIGEPCSGKTTFLRDLIRQLSSKGKKSICVVDEREEIFPRIKSGFCFRPGVRTDVQSGCSKSWGINAVLRAMNPGTIAVDEITAAADCEAMIQAGWCGVHLMATAHASDREDLYTRALYKPIIESGLFNDLIVMHPDKTWHKERITH